MDGRPFTFDLICGPLAWVAQATIGANRVRLEGHGFDIGDVRLVQLHDLRQYVDGSTRFPNLLEGWTS